MPFLEPETDIAGALSRDGAETKPCLLQDPSAVDHAALCCPTCTGNYTAEALSRSARKARCACPGCRRQCTTSSLQPRHLPSTCYWGGRGDPSPSTVAFRGGIGSPRLPDNMKKVGFGDLAWRDSLPTTPGACVFCLPLVSGRAHQKCVFQFPEMSLLVYFPGAE